MAAGKLEGCPGSAYENTLQRVSQVEGAGRHQAGAQLGMGALMQTQGGNIASCVLAARLQKAAQSWDKHLNSLFM